MGHAGGSPKDSKDRIWELARILTEANHICRSIFEKHPGSSRDKYYTKTCKDAALDHIATPLGDFERSGLAEWLRTPAEKEE